MVRRFEEYLKPKERENTPFLCAIYTMPSFKILILLVFILCLCGSPCAKKVFEYNAYTQKKTQCEIVNNFIFIKQRLTIMEKIKNVLKV